MHGSLHPWRRSGLRLDAQALELFTDAVGLAAEPGIIGPFRTAGEPLQPILDRHRTVVSRHPEFADTLREARVTRKIPRAVISRSRATGS